MAERSNQTPESLTPTDVEAARLMSRRKFTRAGLATPIVLSALASKPVLGQVARNCTVSGQVSGNLSSPGDESCFGLGSPPEVWKGEGNWPIAPDTPFDDYLAFDGAYAFENVCSGSSDSTGSSTATSDTASSDAGATGTATPLTCSVVALDYGEASGDGTSATLLQVLELSGGTDLEVLGRQAVAAFLNAKKDPDRFPVPEREVVAMFKQVWPNGGRYKINGTTSWERPQVTSYLMMVNGDLSG